MKDKLEEVFTKLIQLNAINAGELQDLNNSVKDFRAIYEDTDDELLKELAKQNSIYIQFQIDAHIKEMEIRKAILAAIKADCRYCVVKFVKGSVTEEISLDLDP